MPFDRSKYPPDWELISARIKKRDGNRCKFCGLPNGELGKRKYGVWYSWEWIQAQTISTLIFVFGEIPPSPSVIVLTCAHVKDPDPMNCADDNLAALCQDCHLRHDRARHAASAAETRRRKAQDRARARGQVEMGIPMD